jgi:hypothetical protein
MTKRFIARISVRESHPDGTGRVFYVTRIVDDSITLRELEIWRNRKVHAPLDGEFASTEIIITPDDSSGED